MLWSLYNSIGFKMTTKLSEDITKYTKKYNLNQGYVKKIIGKYLPQKKSNMDYVAGRPYCIDNRSKRQICTALGYDYDNLPFDHDEIGEAL